MYFCKSASTSGGDCDHAERGRIEARSRSSNRVNPWYYEQACGCFKSPAGDWTVFWRGLDAAQAMTTDPAESFDPPSMMAYAGFHMSANAAQQVYAQAGIGPEVIDLALASGKLPGGFEFVVLGDQIGRAHV